MWLHQWKQNCAAFYSFVMLNFHLHSDFCLHQMIDRPCHIRCLTSFLNKSWMNPVSLPNQVIYVGLISAKYIKIATGQQWTTCCHAANTHHVTFSFIKSSHQFRTMSGDPINHVTQLPFSQWERLQEAVEIYGHFKTLFRECKFTLFQVVMTVYFLVQLRLVQLQFWCTKCVIGCDMNDTLESFAIANKK